MTDTMKRLAGPAYLTAAAATLYTVPASTVTTILAVHVVNESATATGFAMSIGTDGSGKRIFQGQTVYPGDYFEWSGTIVLASGELIQAFAGNTASLTMTVTGVETT